jgi:Mn-dependent DtxR family transcriptional regulator
MTDLDYRICRVIKLFNEIHNIDPKISDIAKVIQYSNDGTRYHLKKLIKLGLIKQEHRRYILLVNNLE